MIQNALNRSAYSSRCHPLEYGIVAGKIADYLTKLKTPETEEE